MNKQALLYTLLIVASNIGVVVTQNIFLANSFYL